MRTGPKDADRWMALLRLRRIVWERSRSTDFRRYTVTRFDGTVETYQVSALELVETQKSPHLVVAWKIFFREKRVGRR